MYYFCLLNRLKATTLSSLIIKAKEEILTVAVNN